MVFKTDDNPPNVRQTTINRILISEFAGSLNATTSDFIAAQFLQNGSQLVDDTIVKFAIQTFVIVTELIVASELSAMVLDNPGNRFPFDFDQIQPEQNRPKAIFSPNMVGPGAKRRIL